MVSNAPPFKCNLRHYTEGADQRFLSGQPVPPLPPAIALTEKRARDITRAVFGGGGGMLYQAVMQLIGDFFVSP